MPAHQSPDTPIELQGYVTDPKLVGYQILTNYENTYWLRLVGRDAWVLYLVLRSFCHEGNRTCHPSIKLLMNILGLTDRRQLIGRIDENSSQKRVLPGLIDVLQEHNLISAEMVGEGPFLRYVFHVNLTPPLLTAEQLARLPQVLQKKHTQLLERVTESARKLAELKTQKPANVKKTISAKKTEESKEPANSSQTEGVQLDDPGGGGTIPPPPWYSTTPGWYCTTQTTPNNNTQ